MLISKEVSVLWIIHSAIRRITQYNSSNTGSNPVDINVVKESTLEILRVLFATRHHRIMENTLGQFEKLGFDPQWCQVAASDLLRKSEKVGGYGFAKGIESSENHRHHRGVRQTIKAFMPS